MVSLQLLILSAVFLATGTSSVITGSPSLITVPVMLQMGIAPRTALATNMLALTFMSIGATLPFLKQQTINLRRLPLLIGLTLIGSILGAGLVLVIPSKSLPQIVSAAMIAVAVFSIANHRGGVLPAADRPSRAAQVLGYLATFGLGIYGGFFSGGYVTLLTAAYVALFRVTFVGGDATNQPGEIFSSPRGKGV